MRFTKFLKATTLAVFTTGLLSAQTFSGWDVAVKLTTGNVRAPSPIEPVSMTVKR